MDWDGAQDDEPEPDEPDDEEDGAQDELGEAVDPLYAAALLSTEEERSLFTRFVATHDPAIRERLILANTRLVRAVARRYRTRGMTVEDLEMEGMVGLMRAVEKYDVSRGYKFSTYATSWIRQAIGRAIDDQSALIRMPVHAAVRRRRELRRGEEPTYPEYVVLSLDAPVAHAEENDPLSEFIAAPVEDLQDVSVDRVFWRQTLYEALKRLSAREQYVIILRYGLGTNGEAMTLEEVGRGMQVTRERVRQIEAHAMTRLRQWLIQTASGEVRLRHLELVTDQVMETMRLERAVAIRKVARIRAAQTRAIRKQMAAQQQQQRHEHEREREQEKLRERLAS